jgi:hypothetical protein
VKAAPPPLNLTPPFGTIVTFDPNLKLPRTYQWNFGLEKSLNPNQTIALTYVGAVGRGLLREDAVDNVNEDFTLVRITRNTGRSDYHAMQFQAARRLSKGLQALASYTWSHSIDNASSESFSRFGVVVTSADGQLLQVTGDRGPSDFDIRHFLTLAASYTLPAEHLTTRAGALLRNWSIDAIMRARTAMPVNVVAQADSIGDTLLELQRPNLISGVPLYLDDPAVAGGRRINRAAFSAPFRGRQGSLGYNALRGFGVSQFDLGVRRQFHVNERFNLQFKAEFFNLFNHPNFGNPVNLLSSNRFGESIQMFGRSLGSGGINGGLSPLYQIGGARSIQLALKLQF